MIYFTEDHCGSPDYMRDNYCEYCIECGTKFECYCIGIYTGLCDICYDNIQKENLTEPTANSPCESLGIQRYTTEVCHNEKRRTFSI